MDFNKPHLVPQTASGNAMYKGDQQSRQNQISAYKKDRSHNQSQMDTLRQSQYRKQNTAVKDQKRHMANNAAKSSRLVTGTSAYNKEEFTLQDFVAICEGRKKSTSKKQRARTENEKNRKAKTYQPEPRGSRRPRRFDDVPKEQQKAGQETLKARADEFIRKRKEKEAKQKTDEAESARKKKNLKKSFASGVKRKKDFEAAGRRDRRQAKATASAEDRAKRKEAREIEAKKKADERAVGREARDLERTKFARERAAREKAKRESERKHSGLRAGIKQQLGGDLISKDRDVRGKARKDLAVKTSKAIRSAPGKALRRTGQFAGNALKRAQSVTKYQTQGPDSVEAVDKVND